MFNLVVSDEKLIASLEKLIKKYPLAYVQQNKDGKRFNVVVYNKKTNLLDPFSFSIEKDDSKVYFLAKSKKQLVKMDESEFREKIAKKFGVGIISNCLPHPVPVAKVTGGFVQQANDCFANFSNLRLNNGEFDKLCLEKFGMEFNLTNNRPLQIEVLDEKQGIYLLMQNCDDKQNFGALICASQMQEFINGYKQLIGEDKPQQTTYQKVPTMLPTKKTMQPPPPPSIQTAPIKGKIEVKQPQGKMEEVRKSSYPMPSSDNNSKDTVNTSVKMG